jgi:hypothetical protein
VLVLGDFHPKITKSEHGKFAEELTYFDDSPNIIVLRDKKLEISFDDGINFQKVKELEKHAILWVDLDPYYKDRAFAFSEDKTHFVTNDKGKSWSKFEIDTEESELSYPSISINEQNRDLVLFEYYHCTTRRHCETRFYYSKNGFKSNPTKLPIDAKTCLFAKLDKLFEPGKESTIYCTRDIKNSHGHITKSEILMSDDFFSSNKVVDPESFQSGNILELVIDSTFLIAVIQSDKFNTKSRVRILISKDGEHFNEADFNVQSHNGVISFLAHSPQSLFLAVMEYSSLSGESLTTLYSTDSTGLKFNKVMERIHGSAIQNVQTIKGAWIVNVAEEGKDGDKDFLDIVLGGGKVKSYHSFDDGKNWDLLKVNNDDSCKLSDGCSLHLISPNEMNGEGKFVTGPTPGILMGVGNKGKYIQKGVDNMKTWVSRDGGASWDLAIDQPCHFSFGDLGNIILAVPYFGEEHKPVDILYYSLDQGKTWNEEKLERAIRPSTVTTTTDGSSTRFVFNGLIGDKESVFYTVDFSDAFDAKKCGDSDFEEVYSRLDEDGKPVCLYGFKEKFRRRKQDAKCLVRNLFEDLVADEDTCECAETDYECATGFKMSEKGKGTCVPDYAVIKKMCSAEKKKVIKIPDKALIQGNKCELKKPENQFVSMNEFKCTDLLDGDDNSDKEQAIISKHNDFEGKVSYFTYSSVSNGTNPSENILLLTSESIVYASNNEGATFVKVPVQEKVTNIYSGYTSGKVILTTDKKVIYVSDDGGDTFHRREVPTGPGNRRLISFHKTDSEKFIWFGCESSSCATSTAYYTEDNGESFHKLKESVSHCEIVGPHFESRLDKNKDVVFCSVLDDSNGRLLLMSAPKIDGEFKTVVDHMVGFAITGKFVVVAAVDGEHNSLVAKVTVDGETFADADFPSDLHVEAHQAYTILDSATHAIFMHVTTNDEIGKESGALLKSNFNGTFYVLSVDKVNRNGAGFVDYDRIDEIEGTIIINKALISQDKKRLKTQISHNDGGEWSYLTPPIIDSNGKEYECKGKSLEKCSLSLHGFTERPDYRDTFSSTSAVGLLFGVGNVGEYLTDKMEGSTFFSREGGVTWKEVKSTPHLWEFGDRGTILVLVASAEETDSISYSLDEGETWIDYKFVDQKVKVLDLATSPSDTSTKFLIFIESRSDDSTRAVSIDFSNIYQRQCQLDLDRPDHDDYEFWSPSHPNSPDDCLFGHEAKYLRRAIGHNDCFIGSAPLKEGFKVTRNCTCTRRDYECDYNFYRDNDNTCKLVKGLSSEDRKTDMCSKEDAFQYFQPTGYRKIPLSTCVGGKNFDSWDVQPCPGKEKQFNEYYGRDINKSNAWIVFGIPLLITILVTWFVYDRGVRRNGGFKQFGQIRLGGDEDNFQPVENNQVDVVVNKIVRGGIVVAAGLYGGFQVIRKVDRMLLDKITARLFRRSPGNRSYVSVPHLEDEEEDLFGEFHDNYEEELEDATNGISQDYDDFTDQQEITDNVEPNESEPDSRLFDIDDDDDALQRHSSQEN